jgi:hypothetical protein
MKRARSALAIARCVKSGFRYEYIAWRGRSRKDRVEESKGNPRGRY